VTAPPGSVAALRARLRAWLAGQGDAATLEADLLLAHALNRSRAWLIAHGHDPLPDTAAAAAEALARRRLAGEPVAYLLGYREFWSMSLTVTPAVLIPRPETERLVECALEHLAPQHRALVCDLGTGSGAVALAIARERPATTIVACDHSRAALAVAAANVRRLAPGRVRTVCCDFLAGLAGGCFDLVVSNPPYVAEADPCLDTGDLRHEPRVALASGPEGLDALARIARNAPPHLVPGGWLLVEHGAGQGAAVRALLTGGGLVEVTTRRDLAGHERVTAGQRPRRAAPAPHAHR
jgi:release factor glutamine methyltransferase